MGRVRPTNPLNSRPETCRSSWTATQLTFVYTGSRPKPARRGSPKLPDARTDLLRLLRLRSSRSWPPGPGHLEVRQRDKVCFEPDGLGKTTNPASAGLAILQ